jgi:hypothetical protein
VQERGRPHHPAEDPGKVGGPAWSVPLAGANRYQVLNGLDVDDVNPSPRIAITITPPSAPFNPPPKHHPSSSPSLVSTARRSAPLPPAARRALAPSTGCSLYGAPIARRSAPFVPYPSTMLMHSYRSLLPQHLRDAPAAAFSLADATDHPLLRFSGHLGGHAATFLIDSGATNDFVSTAFVQRHALTLAPSTRNVRGYDGAASASAGDLAAELTLDTDSVPFADVIPRRLFTAVNLRGEDAILGQPWLRSINPSVCWATGALQIAASGLTPQCHLVPAPPVLTSSGSGAQLINYLCQLYRSSACEADDNPTTDGRLVRAVAPPHRDRAPSSPPPDAELEARRAKAFAEYADVFPADLPDGLPPSRELDHRIELKPGSPPPARAGLRYSRADDAGIAAFVEENLKKGFIKPSQSSYSAIPFQVSKKGTTERRTVVDFRALNEQTVKSRYPLPRMDTLFDQLQGAQYFSKLDLRTGFHQIRIAAEDTHKTAFRTSKGLFEYLVLAMGLCNAPGTFMQLMNETFADLLNKGVLVFLDDIIIYSKTLAEHERLLATVLQRLRAKKLYAKQSKCSLFQQEVEFLGHYVGVNGLRIMDDKLAAVTEWPAPKNVKEVRAFLGLVGFYRKFVRGFSMIALPLTLLTRTVTGGPFQWGTEQQLAFLELKRALQHAPLLLLPDPTLPFVLHTDASGFALGAVLQQDQGQGLQPVAFLSKKLVDAETRYPVHEQELLAIVTALTTWRHYLEGSQGLRVLTDHKSLTFFQTQPMLSGRQVRWLETLSLFDFTIEYIVGATNVVADALSRRADLNTGTAPSERPPSFVDPVVKDRSSCKLLRLMKIFTESSDSSPVGTAAQLTVVRIAAERQAELQRQQARARAITSATSCVEPARDRPAPNAAGSIVTPTQRCTAEKKGGGQCGARTAKGQHCWNHLRSTQSLRIKPSSIAGAGMGLFAERDFRSGEHITDYTGDYHALRHDRDGGPYHLQLTRHRSIDAARTNTAAGRWLNDPHGSGQRTNSEFVMNHARGTGRIRANRTIAKGDEIFISYGASYWPAERAAAKLKQPRGQGRKRRRRAGAAVDADAADLLLTVLTTVHSSLAEEITAAGAADPQWADELAAHHDDDDRTQSVNGHLYLDGRLCIPPNAELRTRLIRECHDAAVSGHLGRDKTSEQLRRRFYWSGMDSEVERYVTSCDPCQRNKPSQQSPIGLLQPLPIPPRAWHTVSMDLITALPRSRNAHDAIVVFVCKLTRMVHFVPCVTAITAPQLAQLFTDNVVRLHGLPECILSDRDPRFTASFWKSFWSGLGTSLAMSTSYHPQTDGQTENSNKTLETILRSTVNFEQTDWDHHLTAAELAVNNSKNATTGYTPFFLVHGYEMRMPLDAAIAPLRGADTNATASTTLARWKAALTHAHANIEAAQARQARYADTSRRDAIIRVGDRVLLSTKNIQLLGDAHRTRKLSARFIGPYTVVRKVGANAYELELPAALRIHRVINVSNLKPYVDPSSIVHRPAAHPRPPPEAGDAFGQVEYAVERVLDHRSMSHGRIEYLVLWEGYPPEEASWEPAAFLANSPELVIQYHDSESAAPRRRRKQAPRQHATRASFPPSLPPVSSL